MKKPSYNRTREYENRVNELRVEEGYTLKTLAGQIGVTPGWLWHISQGYSTPLMRGGGIKEWAKRMMKALHAELAYIFPREICEIKRGELIEMQLADALHGDYDDFVKYELEQNIETLLGSLPDERMKPVILMRLCSWTFEDIGCEFHITRERVRQIEARALRYMKHPAYRKLVSAWKDEAFDEAFPVVFFEVQDDLEELPPPEEPLNFD